MFDRERGILNSKMPVSVLNAVPVAARHGEVLDAGRRLWLARLPTVLLGAALGGLVFLWGRELFGFPGGALALFLYTFCPNVLAHSHLVTTDIATALGMFGATFAFWRYRRQPGPAGWRWRRRRSGRHSSPRRRRSSWSRSSCSSWRWSGCA